MKINEGVRVKTNDYYLGVVESSPVSSIATLLPTHVDNLTNTCTNTCKKPPYTHRHCHDIDNED